MFTLKSDFTSMRIIKGLKFGTQGYGVWGSELKWQLFTTLIQLHITLWRSQMQNIKSH